MRILKLGGTILCSHAQLISTLFQLDQFHAPLIRQNTCRPATLPAAENPNQASVISEAAFPRVDVLLPSEARCAPYVCEQLEQWRRQEESRLRAQRRFQNAQGIIAKDSYQDGENKQKGYFWRTESADTVFYSTP